MDGTVRVTCSSFYTHYPLPQEKVFVFFPSFSQNVMSSNWDYCGQCTV